MRTKIMKAGRERSWSCRTNHGHEPDGVGQWSFDKGQL